MKWLACSLGIVGRIPRLVHADAAFWTCAWAPTEDRRRLQRKAATAAWTNETKSEYANGTDEKKPEDSHPQVIGRPGGGSPTTGQHADDNQADQEKPVPSAQLVPD